MNPIHISADVQVSPELAWQCYTQPEHIIGWNFADTSWCCPWAENDL